MGEDFTIRAAKPSDLAAWVECSAQLFAEDAGTRDTTMNLDWPRQHGADGFSSGLDDAERLLLVAVASGGVAATLSAKLGEATAVRPVRVATLVSLYVRPQHRGGGVGAGLVERFRRWARDAGADRVAVTAYAANEGAVRFYRRQGLVPFHVTLEADA